MFSYYQNCSSGLRSADQHAIFKHGIDSYTNEEKIGLKKQPDNGPILNEAAEKLTPKVKVPMKIWSSWCILLC